VTRDEVAHPKPAADGILAAARALCPGGGAVWYAGDTPRDVAAGRAARTELGPGLRLQVVAVLGGRGAEAALREAGADHVVARLAGIAALVEAG
jgi:phosphoglycolate phosphatase-like HAD superfamily hydrolase